MHRTPDPVEIDLLGGFVVRVEGSPVPDDAWRRRHSAALVKILALAPQQRLHREQVIDLLWPEVALPDAAPRLHKAAHYARHTLGRSDAVVLRGDTVHLLPDVPVVVDAVRFEREAQEALTEGSATAAERALASYGGVLLPAEPYDEWLAAPRERLRGLHQRLLRQARRWSELLEEDPLDENAHLEVLKDLVKRGQRVAALRHYQQLVESFRRELGVEPPPAHQRIHRGLLATANRMTGQEPAEEGGPEPTAPAALHRPRSRIPAPLRGRLVGRDLDLAAVDRLLGEFRLVTLAGPGGAGKSTLAMAVARRLADTGAEVIVAELAPARERHGLLRTVAESAGIEGTATVEVADLAEALGRRELTLVLDNCEHLLDDCAELVDALLDAGPASRVVATSREPLGVDGEAVRRIGSLGASASELFVERARAATGDVTLDAEDPRVAELCEHLDGLPLAIELAAAQLPHLSIDALIGRLDDRLRLLVRDRPRAGRRHSTLGATIEWSYQLLEDTSRQVFDRLGVFPADFDLAAAQAVSGAGDGAATALAVRDLVAKSLLVHEPEGGRYRYLETIRLFARTRLEDSGLLAETTELLRTHVVDLARRRPRPERWLSATAAAEGRDDIDNVRLAFEASLARGDTTAGVDLAIGLSTLWRNSVRFGEGMAWVAALERAPLRPHDRLWRELVRADVGLGSGDARAMRQAARAAYELARETEDATALEIAAMYRALFRQDRLSGAEELTEVAERLRAMGEEGLERLVRGFTVVTRLAAGRREGAEQGLAEALADEAREYDRYICVWAAWLTALADRDGPRLRRLMEDQLENLRSSGLGGNWLTMFSEAMTLIGGGEDYLGQLRATKDRAASEGRVADADCVLALAYAAACEGDAVRAAELVGTGGELFRDTANYFALVVVRDLVVRPLLAPEEMEAAVARGQEREPADVLAEHGL